MPHPVCFGAAACDRDDPSPARSIALRGRWPSALSPRALVLRLLRVELTICTVVVGRCDGMTCTSMGLLPRRCWSRVFVLLFRSALFGPGRGGQDPAVRVFRYVVLTCFVAIGLYLVTCACGLCVWRGGGGVGRETGKCTVRTARIHPVADNSVNWIERHMRLTQVTRRTLCKALQACFTGAAPGKGIAPRLITP